MWKNELVEILFSSDPSKLNVKKAINLKYENTPSSLYRYRSFDDNGYSLELLKTDEMYLSRPDEFNDPFDCALKMATIDLPEDYIKKIIVPYTFNKLKQNYGCSNKEYGKLMRSKNVIHDLAKLVVKTTISNISLELREEIIKDEEENFYKGFLDPEFKDKIHVACFSETNKGILMWSHYANDHKGFCIEYNFKELGINSPVTRFIFPVTYNETLFDLKDYLPDPNKEFDNVLKKYMDEIKANDILDRAIFPKSNKNLNNMLVFYNALIKYVDWAYEKEWRYVFTMKTDEKMYLNVPKPKSIYLGANVSKENCEKILKIGKERDINVYKMEIRSNEFALESKLIHKCKD